MLRSLVLIAITCLIVCHVLSGLNAPAAERSKPERGSVVTMDQGWVGVGSCAALGCHGKVDSEGGTGGEYTTWISRDKHSRAYEVLYEDLSERIMENLMEEVPAHQSTRCLNCHAMSLPAGLVRAKRFTLSDGVGCESCHGPAKGWLEPHTTAQWKDKSSKEKARLGMTPTKDILVRARVCVACHVGDSNRQVDHDLISAGHPRLNFELGVFLELLPAHWDREKDRQRVSAFEAHVWAVGQVTAAEAALGVLESRARLVAAGESTPWPEFAEYNCFACHHDLKAQSWRQLRDLRDGKKNEKALSIVRRTPGTLPWGTWYYPMSLALARQLNPDLIEDLDDLRRDMEQPWLDPANVAEKAGALKREFSDWANLLNSKTFSDEQVGALASALAREESGTAADCWDVCTQYSLAIFALQLARRDRSERPGEEKREAKVFEELKTLIDMLSFPDGFNSPREYELHSLDRQLEKLRHHLIGE